MQVHYGEGVAIHTGPEPCVVAREDGSEASAGERIGVGACNHAGSCSQTERIPARISRQWGERRAHIARHCARHHRAVLANGGSCSH